jgi:hypothetical protein
MAAQDPLRSSDLSSALFLRGWVFRLFTEPERIVERPESDLAHVSPATWGAFLRSERCSVPLYSRITTLGLLDRIGAEAQAMIRSFATHELKCVLAAREELQHIAAWSNSETSTRVIVLKGAVGVLVGRPLYLSDVDLLVEPSVAGTITGFLEARGYHCQGQDGFTDGFGSRHLAPRRRTGGLQIEVHLGINHVDDLEGFRSRSIPLEGVRSLYRLSPGDHLWHLLVHTAVHHRDRRGRIRDLLLIADTIAECSASELTIVEERLAKHEFAEPLSAVFTTARALAARQQVRDPFRYNAAARFAIVHGVHRTGAMHDVADPAATMLFVMLGFRCDWLKLWHDLIWFSEDGSTNRHLGRLDRVLPGAHRTVAMGVRLAGLAAGAFRSWGLSRTIRRVANQADGNGASATIPASR